MKATTGFAIILRRGATPLLLACAMGALAPGAHAAAVAMVTDLQGKATLSSVPPAPWMHAVTSEKYRLSNWIVASGVVRSARAVKSRMSAKSTHSQ